MLKLMLFIYFCYQVDFMVVHFYSAIEIHCNILPNYVTSFKVSVSNDSLEWNYHQSNGNDHVCLLVLYLVLKLFGNNVTRTKSDFTCIINTDMKKV